MLKKRLITALILIAIVLSGLYFLTTTAFCILSGVLTLAAAAEWTNFMGLKKISSRFLYLLIMTLLAVISAKFILIPVMLFIGFAWWVLAAIFLFFYPRRALWGESVFWRGLMGVFVLIPTWVAINYIFMEENGRLALLYVFVLIWGADSAAYFVGKKWGTQKLAPSISPGKTVQGLMGALVFTLIFAMFVQWICEIPINFWGYGTMLSLITVLFSVEGDLFESMMKRNVALKDSGSLLPGHGGILDRIDSITAAVPVFAFGSMLLGIYLA